MQLLDDFTNSKNWLSALDERASVNAEPAVYILLHQHPVGRLHGESRILYVGSTRQLGGSSESCRLRTYRYPNGTHANELRRRVQQLTDSGIEVTLKWVHMPSKTDAVALESRLLQQYLAAHGELPPFNSRS